MRSLVDINDLSKIEILNILELANKFKNGFTSDVLSNKIIASCFFESSTRTRLSFEAAILKLKGKIIGFTNSHDTSINKGESFVDSIQIINNYADMIILRHHLDGAAKLADDISTIPIINAGDGSHCHPTQALTDLFAIAENTDDINNIHLGIMGDLKHSRTVHSLIKSISLFNNVKLYFISPEELRLSNNYLFTLKCRGIQYSFHYDIQKVINNLDFLYITRLQKERFINNMDVNYNISLSILNNVKNNFKILHPLPRLTELPIEIDDTKYAYYFEQAKNSIFVRQALLHMIFTNTL